MGNLEMGRGAWRIERGAFGYEIGFRATQTRTESRWTPGLRSW
jgi:hypothetical protein